MARHALAPGQRPDPVRWAARPKKPAGREYCDADRDRCGGLAVVQLDQVEGYRSDWWDATYLLCAYHLREAFTTPSSGDFWFGTVVLTSAPGCAGWLPPGITDPAALYGVDLSAHRHRAAGLPGAAASWWPSVPPARPTWPVSHSVEGVLARSNPGHWLTRPIGGNVSAGTRPWARRALTFYCGAVLISFLLRATGIL